MMENLEVMMTARSATVNVLDIKGFTLIEIAVVILVLGLFVSFALPKFGDISDVNLKSTARNLSMTVRYLYSEAAFKKNIYKLVFDTKNNEYWVEILEGNEYEVSTDPFLRKKKITGNVFLKDIITERTLGKTKSDENQDYNYILFLPTGYVEPAVIHIESNNGDVYTLATNPYTGTMKIYDEYKDIMINHNN